MIMSEYEERFRSPTPSLHQIFVEARGPNRGRMAESTPLGCRCLGRCNDINV